MTQNKQGLAGRARKVLVVLILGAIGSGLWELIFRGIILQAAELFATGISFVWHGYFDFLYSDVGAQRTDLASLPGMLILILVVLLPYISYRRFNSEIDELQHYDETTHSLSSEQAQREKEKIKYYLIPLTILSFVYMGTLVKVINNKFAVDDMTRWLDISRPYLEERQYFLLISEFRRVESRSDYQNLADNLRKLMKESEIELPQLRAFGLT
ncbi:hypothetical protein [Alteromonas macleodii]|uniref:hypothetical protein n=1 Tax=Alteromonas macleodii TaxID=28108 RepID=UPI0022AF0D01|nr:hypothetical protein [Alteromonas macleodii]MCZ4241425.1 hypothetical protein [Alteromonas macleodii]